MVPVQVPAVQHTESNVATRVFKVAHSQPGAAGSTIWLTAAPRAESASSAR